jgi:ketosteroid isomerase-like protein
MSQENVEIVKRSLEAFTQRDVATMRELNDADLELDWSASVGVEARVYRGIDDALAFYRGYFEAFESIVFDELDFIDAGESVVVVPNKSRSRGRDGIEVSARSTFVFTIHGRKIVRLRLYQETEEALKAVGLAE